MIRVLIADDETLMRGGVRAMLEAEADLEVVGEAADGAEAVDEALRTHPDVVLVDVHMPRLDGIEATRRILGRHAVRAGARSSCSGSASAGRAGAPTHGRRSSARSASSTSSARTRGPTARAELRATGAVEGERAPAPVERLTPRELQVALLVAQGLTNREVGASLFLSAKTVEHHLGATFRKLEVRSRVQLAGLLAS